MPLGSLVIIQKAVGPVKILLLKNQKENSHILLNNIQLEFTFDTILFFNMTKIVGKYFYKLVCGLKSSSMVISTH